MTAPEALSIDVQESAALAALAYVTDTPRLKQLVSDPAMPMAGHAQIVWGPQEKESNRAFVAKVEAPGGAARYVVAIRGTVGSVASIFEDVELTLVKLPWSTTRHADARISDGIADGEDDIIDPPSRRSGSVSTGNDLEPNDTFIDAVV